MTCPDVPECTCAMTESTFRACEMHGEDAFCEVCKEPWIDHRPTEQAAEAAGAFCADCLSLMVEDNGCGYLCPACDAHPNCANFPCSGEPEMRTPLCPLNAPLTILDRVQTALTANAKAEAEIAGQMKHITAEMVRGDQLLEAKEELIADLRARVSHAEAERDAARERAATNRAGWAQMIRRAEVAETEVDDLRARMAKAQASAWGEGYARGVLDYTRDRDLRPADNPYLRAALADPAASQPTHTNEEPKP